MRDETLVWVRHCLGFEPAVTPTPSNSLIRNFASVGKYMQEKYDSCKYSRRRTRKTLLTWLKLQSAEGKAPSADRVLREGVRRRAADWAPQSVADIARVQAKKDGHQRSLRVPGFDRVSFYCLLSISCQVEYQILTRPRRFCYSMRLPHSVTEDSGLARLWEAANIIISM